MAASEFPDLANKSPEEQIALVHAWSDKHNPMNMAEIAEFVKWANDFAKIPNWQTIAETCRIAREGPKCKRHSRFSCSKLKCKQEREVNVNGK